MSKITIGIDLGTTYSCVGVYENGRVEIIQNNQGSRITPSVVAFTDIEVLIGDAAKNQILKNLPNTIFDAKRLIGLRLEDNSVKEDMKLWPFTVVNDDGRPKIQIQSLGNSKTIFPEAISAMVLGELKAAAENYLGKEVSDAVITVPAYFNNSQRQATKNAGAIAGLKVVRLINEPTAAAIAFGFDKKISKKTNVLIYDLGGGTFDVSIISIDSGKFDVKAVGGNPHLGGVDFDTRMVNHFIKEFNVKHNVDMSTNKKAVQRLRIKCERAKRTLSSSFESNLNIENFYNDIDFDASIMRATFDNINGDLFRSTLKDVEIALSNAKLRKYEIDEILLVGGSTRIPKIRQLLQEFFIGQSLNNSINADEAVGYGAAVVAGIVSGAVHNIKYTDVAPLSLGVETTGGVMSTLIPRNTIIPTKITNQCTTDEDHQLSVYINVYEGENTMTKDNYLLGNFELCGIPPMPCLVPEIEVTFDIDFGGIFTVTAEEKSTGKSVKIIIEDNRGLLTKADIERIIAEEEIYRHQQVTQRYRIEKKNSFLNYMLEKKESRPYNDNIVSKYTEILAWLNNNPYATEEELEIQREEFDEVCSP